MDGLPPQTEHSSPKLPPSGYGRASEDPDPSPSIITTIPVARADSPTIRWSTADGTIAVVGSPPELSLRLTPIPPSGDGGLSVSGAGVSHSGVPSIGGSDRRGQVRVPRLPGYGSPGDRP